MKKIILLCLCAISFSSNAKYSDGFTRICSDAISKLNSSSAHGKDKINAEFLARANHYSDSYYKNAKLNSNDIEKIKIKIIDTCKNYPYMKVDASAARSVSSYVVGSVKMKSPTSIVEKG